MPCWGGLCVHRYSLLSVWLEALRLVRAILSVDISSLQTMTFTMVGL